jgi:hypothetical protein
MSDRQFCFVNFTAAFNDLTRQRSPDTVERDDF